MKHSWYVTCHIQKDGRINLGTAAHAWTECPALRGRCVVQISGEIVGWLPKCLKCAPWAAQPLDLKCPCCGRKVSPGGHGYCSARCAEQDRREHVD